ncbi:MAG TPA: GAF domain-containing protein [Anaerolineae bacterium]|nr:GAF domain-containing protein [Anaerolineae bacterium]
MNDQSTHDGKLADQLRRLLEAIEASGHAILPSSNRELLQSIVDAAARIFGAAAASIALLNEKDQMLEFKVSYGIGNENVVGMRLPMDKGIAGYVIMTGQPLAISNLQQDKRFNKDFAQTTGYVPKSILAMPMMYGERLIGVMEVLDKISSPSFGMKDMELLAMFAQQAAIAIHQSQQYDMIGQALVHGIKELAMTDPDAQSAEIFQVIEAATIEDQRGRELLELAGIFNSIADLGEAERTACLKILTAFRDFAKSKSAYA